ncbi:MAG: tetratricopeptide repeat protein [Alphaproteobacteria bacterium]|nr:tetratricopeptide repeat protein [Alphaproteobacteria bacterium]
MRRARLAWLGLLLLTGCAGRALNPAPPEGMEPAWDPSEAGSVRLDVVDALVDTGDYDNALRMIGAMRAEGMTGERLDLIQGRALLGQGLYGEALDLLEDGFSTNPERDRLIGLIHLEMGNVEEAIDANRRALRHSPRRGEPNARAELLNNLGFSLAAAGRHDEALDAYTEALRLNPGLARARNNMGFSLAALERDVEALNTFLAVQRTLTPDETTAQANAHYNLGLAREARGDHAGARASYARALEIAPSHDRAGAALTALATASSPPEVP